MAKLQGPAWAVPNKDSNLTCAVRGDSLCQLFHLGEATHTAALLLASCLRSY